MKRFVMHVAAALVVSAWALSVNGPVYAETKGKDVKAESVKGKEAAPTGKILKLEKNSSLKVGSEHRVDRIEVPPGAKVKVAPDKRSADFAMPGGNVVLRAGGCGCTKGSNPNHCYVGQDGSCYPTPHGHCDECGGMNVQVLGTQAPAKMTK